MKPSKPRALLAAALVLGAATWGGAADTRDSFPEEAPEAVLHNPGMGWVLYENFALDPRAGGTGTMNLLPAERFGDCDCVAVMFAWSDVEKEAGRFDWNRVDQACDWWLQRGKELHLRLSTEPLFGWSRTQPPGGLGIPDWLLARIPDDQKKRREDGAMFGWHVDARHALYRERLEIFLKEVRAHFVGARTPALIDLRGFGRWGEWHSGYPYATAADRRAALRGVLDTWSRCIPDRMLALSYSHDPDGPRELYAGPCDKLDPAFTNRYPDYLRFSAFDLALDKTNITLRRDGAGGAVCPNQRVLCEHAYRDLRRAPLSSEFVSGYGAARKGGDAWVNWMVDDALRLHPNYIGLLGYGGKDALDFIRERPDLVARGLRQMGYRLVPVRVSLPRAIQPGRDFIMEMEWVNRAAGRALRDFALRLRLAGAGGRAVAEADAGVLPTSTWLEGERHVARVTASFAPFAADAGEATLMLSLRDPGTGRAIRLPLAQDSPDAFYPVGTVEVLQ